MARLFGTDGIRGTANKDPLKAQQTTAPPAYGAAPAPAAGGLSDADMAKLKQLADLHAAGALSDAEFESAKQKILG